MTKSDFGIWFTGITLIVFGAAGIYFDYHMISDNVLRWYQGKFVFIAALAVLSSGVMFLRIAFGSKDEERP